MGGVRGGFTHVGTPGTLETTHLPRAGADVGFKCTLTGLVYLGPACGQTLYMHAIMCDCNECVVCIGHAVNMAV